LARRLTGDGRRARSPVDDGDVPLADAGVAAQGTGADVGTAVSAADRRQCRRQRRMMLLLLMMMTMRAGVLDARVSTAAHWSPAFIQHARLGRLARRVGARVCHTYADSDVISSYMSIFKYGVCRLGNVRCGQSAGLIKMALSTKVGIGPGHIVLDGDPGSPCLGTQGPHVWGPRHLNTNCK